MTKKTFIIKGMHCPSCALMIESDLEDIGVKSSCSYAKQTLTVEFDENKMKEQMIRDVVAKAGYQVE